MRKCQAITASVNAMALAALAPISTCHAQVASATNTPDKPANTSADTPAITDIVVTAQRRSEPLQSVPLSIAVLSGTTLAKNNASSLNDVINLVPAVHFGETGFGDTAIIVNIRGEGTFGGRNPAVGLYIDEVPLPQVGPSAPGAYVGGKGLFFDLENAQVVKGPQGTLFGRNTTGGAMLLQTRMPGDTFGGNLEASYGNYNDFQIQGGLDIPLVADKLAVRAAFFVEKRDGYVDLLSTPAAPNGAKASNVDARNVRVTALWTPSDTIKNTLVVGSYRSHSLGNQLIINALLPGSFVPFIFPQVNSVIAQQQALGIRTALPQSISPKYNTDVLTISNTTEIKLGNELKLRNIFGFDEQKNVFARSFDGSGLSLYENFNVGEVQPRYQYTEELQLQGRNLNDKFDWTAGVFYFNLPTNGYDDVETIAFNNAFGPPTQIATDYSEKSLAFYAQGSYDLVQKLKFTAGVRYTIDKAGGFQRVLNAQAQCVAPAAPYDANCNLGQNGTWKVPTWNFTLDYTPTNHLLVYATINRGFRSGGFNLTSITDPSRLSYGIEKLTNYELGIKADWEIAGMPVRTNAAIFHDVQQGAQVTEDISPAGSGSLTLGVLNAADIDLNGGEVDLTVKPAKHLELTASGSYLHAHFYNFAPGSTPADIELATDTLTYGRPKYLYSFGVNYTIPLKNNGEINFYANLSGTSEMYSSQSVPLTRFDPYALLNLNVTWKRALGGPFDVSFFMTNATNKVYKNYVIASSSLGYAAYGYGEPRMFGFRVNYKF